MKRILAAFLFMAFAFFFGNSYAQEELKVTGPPSASTLSFLPMEEGKVLATVMDAKNNPILGLKDRDFVIRKGVKTAKILSVEPLELSKEISLNVVLVVDNSFSMKKRNAIEPLLSALEEFSRRIRSIDNINVVVFDEKNTASVAGLSLHAKALHSNNPTELKMFFRKSFSEGLTDGTYLYDAMVEGLDLVRKMPKESHKFLLVFSDGEDINSVARTSDVESLAKGIDNFSSYAVDYLPGPAPDRFLKSFSETHGGKLWKVASASEFLPIFNSFTNTLLHRYIITFRFLYPPKGSISLDPATVTIEEVTTIDTSPFLNYIFFETGKSEIPPRYALLSAQNDIQGFSEESLKDPMEKYHHILNIAGKRLVESPDASITLVGCNSNTGDERGKLDLSRSRAESVRSYLRYVWGIDPSRMDVKAQNLPAAPSTNRIEEGRAENQRVEIQSVHPAILDTIKSTYVQEMSDTKVIRVIPQIQAESGVSEWKLDLTGDGKALGSAEGQGDPPSAQSFDLMAIGLGKVAALRQLSAHADVTDKEGEVFKTDASNATAVKFIRREERMAQKQGYKVLEKYALILFDFDSSEIKERNKVIVDRIIARMKQFPSAVARIVGHTDNIGKEDYNLKLSERRAKAVYEQMLVSAMTGGLNISYEGAGPYKPLYDNTTPEGRALNRTVTVTLEYETKE